MVEGDGALEDIVRLRAADVAKVVEEAKREQEQGGLQPLGDVEALGADLEQSCWRRLVGHATDEDDEAGRGRLQRSLLCEVGTAEPGGHAGALREARNSVQWRASLVCAGASVGTGCCVFSTVTSKKVC